MHNVRKNCRYFWVVSCVEDIFQLLMNVVKELQFATRKIGISEQIGKNCPHKIIKIIIVFNLNVKVEEKMKIFILFFSLKVFCPASRSHFLKSMLH